MPTKAITISPTPSIPRGSWREAETIRRGYELNDRLFSVPVEKHQGTLPPEYSFVQLQPDNVVLTAVKKAEDDNALVLRFYEWAVRKQTWSYMYPEALVPRRRPI